MKERGARDDRQWKNENENDQANGNIAVSFTEIEKNVGQFL